MHTHGPSLLGAGKSQHLAPPHPALCAAVTRAPARGQEHTGKWEWERLGQPECRRPGRAGPGRARQDRAGQGGPSGCLCLPQAAGNVLSAPLGEEAQRPQLLEAWPLTAVLAGGKWWAGHSAAVGPAHQAWTHEAAGWSCSLSHAHPGESPRFLSRQGLGTTSWVERGPHPHPSGRGPPFWPWAGRWLPNCEPPGGAAHQGQLRRL